MSESQLVEKRWLQLCKWGGLSAFVIAILLVGEVIVYAALPDPNTPVEIFALFKQNWLLGLLHFDLLGMISYLFFIPFSLALYLTLQSSDEAPTLVATTMFLIGVAAFFATNTGFSTLALSHQYEAAKTAEEQAMLLAAGQAMMTLFDVNAFLMSYVLVSGAWVLTGWVMLRSELFSRMTAIAGMMAGACGILGEILEHISESTRGAAIAFYFAAIVFLFIWVLNAGKRLYRIGSSG